MIPVRLTPIMIDEPVPSGIRASCEKTAEAHYLLKLGELTLKGGNKHAFEKKLLANLTLMLKGSGARVICKDGRFFVQSVSEVSAQVEDALSRLAGISGWARVRPAEKNIEAVCRAAVCEAESSFKEGARSFKVESRRTDKRFPLRSYDLNCAAADAITLALPGFKVDVHNPDMTLHIEIREKAFIYAGGHKGLRGLPVGTAGRALLLLSGGIDSPVAGFLMALRGLSLSALYFHAYPYTSDDAKQKVVTLADRLRCWTPRLKLFVASFTAVQQRIKERAPESWATVLLRMAMMESASELARRLKCKCLITGESLSQVASQTVENIACSESKAAFPVMRPLIGMDKETIIRKAVEIGTYQTSILPYSDCCALFSPEHPVIYGKLDEASRLYESLEIAPLIDAALSSCEVFS